MHFKKAILQISHSISFVMFNQKRKIKKADDSNGITKNNMYRCKIPRMQQSAELVKSKFGARSFFIRQNNT